MQEDTSPNVDTFNDILEESNHIERENAPRLQRQRAIDRQYSNTFNTIVQSSTKQEDVQEGDLDHFELARNEANIKFNENNEVEAKDIMLRIKELKHSSLEVCSLDDLCIAPLKDLQ